MTQMNVRERVKLTDLTPHPRNYRRHPDDQIEHLRASIRQFGVFRNLVVAREGTILAGHGVAEAAALEGVEEVDVTRLDLDPDSPEALKVLALDNEVGRFAEIDDRALTELLREVSQQAIDGLLGTGYDEMILANLVMVTRTAAEVSGFDAAREWVGMPDYEAEGPTWKLIVQFATDEDRQRFIDEYRLRDSVMFSKATPTAASGWWPAHPEVRHDGGLKWEQPEAG